MGAAVPSAATTPSTALAAAPAVGRPLMPDPPSAVPAAAGPAAPALALGGSAPRPAALGGEAAAGSPGAPAASAAEPSSSPSASPPLRPAAPPAPPPSLPTGTNAEQLQASLDEALHLHRPAKETAAAIGRAVGRLQSILLREPRLCGARLRLVGSHAAGLAVPESDVNVVLSLPLPGLLMGGKRRAAPSAAVATAVPAAGRAAAAVTAATATAYVRDARATLRFLQFLLDHVSDKVYSHLFVLPDEPPLVPPRVIPVSLAGTSGGCPRLCLTDPHERLNLCLTLAPPPAAGVDPRSAIDDSAVTAPARWLRAVIVAAGDLRVRDVVVLVKRWAHARQVHNDEAGFPSSYAWTISVLTVLHTWGMVPWAVARLRGQDDNGKLIDDGGMERAGASPAAAADPWSVRDGRFVLVGRPPPPPLPSSLPSPTVSARRRRSSACHRRRPPPATRATVCELLAAFFAAVLRAVRPPPQRLLPPPRTPLATHCATSTWWSTTPSWRVLT